MVGHKLTVHDVVQSAIKDDKMVNIASLGWKVILLILLLIQKMSKHKKKKQKKEKEKDEKEKKKKKRHHHHHHHSEGDGRDSVQNGTVEEEEPLPVSRFPTPEHYSMVTVQWCDLARSSQSSLLLQYRSSIKTC